MFAGSYESRFSFILEFSEERSEYITNELIEFNRTRQSPLWSSPPQSSVPLQVYALDDNQAVVGGFIGETNGVPEWLEVSILWVAEDARGQGVGGHLMSLAEEEAIRRGCRYARLATSDYQAPDFYRKIGYAIYGTLENCPRGETVHYLYKELT